MPVRDGPPVFSEARNFWLAPPIGDDEPFGRPGGRHDAARGRDRFPATPRTGAGPQRRVQRGAHRRAPHSQPPRRGPDAGISPVPKATTPRLVGLRVRAGRASAAPDMRIRFGFTPTNSPPAGPGRIGWRAHGTRLRRNPGSPLPERGGHLSRCGKSPARDDASPCGYVTRRTRSRASSPAASP